MLINNNSFFIDITITEVSIEVYLLIQLVELIYIRLKTLIRLFEHPNDQVRTFYN